MLLYYRRGGKPSTDCWDVCFSFVLMKQRDSRVSNPLVWLSKLSDNYWRFCPLCSSVCLWPHVLQYSKHNVNTIHVITWFFFFLAIHLKFFLEVKFFVTIIVQSCVLFPSDSVATIPWARDVCLSLLHLRLCSPCFGDMLCSRCLGFYW